MQQSSIQRRISVPVIVQLQRFHEARRCFSQNTGGGAGAEHHEAFLKQMQELQAERDTLFGFTDDDRNGWANNSKDHQFDHSFLDEINQARDKHYSSSSDATQSDTSELSDIAETQLPDTNNNKNNNHDGFAGLSHLSTDGTSVHMVNVGDKQVTSRVAVAQSIVILPHAVIKAFHKKENVHDLVGPKGPIFATAKVAGIMAAKYVFVCLPASAFLRDSLTFGLMFLMT
jgi:MoaC family